MHNRPNTFTTRLHAIDNYSCHRTQRLWTSLKITAKSISLVIAHGAERRKNINWKHKRRLYCLFVMCSDFVHVIASRIGLCGPWTILISYVLVSFIIGASHIHHIRADSVWVHWRQWCRGTIWSQPKYGHRLLFFEFSPILCGSDDPASIQKMIKKMVKLCWINAFLLR